MIGVCNKYAVQWSKTKTKLSDEQLTSETFYYIILYIQVVATNADCINAQKKNKHANRKTFLKKKIPNFTQNVSCFQ